MVWHFLELEPLEMVILIILNNSVSVKKVLNICVEKFQLNFYVQIIMALLNIYVFIGNSYTL